MKKTKTAMMISSATTLVLFMIAMVSYIRTGLWDGQLSGLIACNAAICGCVCDKYNKMKKAE